VTGKTYFFHKLTCKCWAPRISWLGTFGLLLISLHHSLAEGFSLGSPVFLPPQKPASPSLNSTRIEDLHEKPDVASSL